MAIRGQELKDKRNFLEFLQKADLTEAWIQEKVGTQLGTEVGQGETQACILWPPGRKVSW